MNNAVNENWQKAAERHRVAVKVYRQTAERVDDADWRLPVGAGKWSAAQITEHLILTYRVTLGQMRGGGGIKPQYNFLLQNVLRRLALPKILRSGKLPPGAQAPAEILPEDSPQTQRDALAQFKALSVEFEEQILAARADENAFVTHHVFGKLNLLKAFELAAIHIENHERQLPRRKS